MPLINLTDLSKLHKKPITEQVIFEGIKKINEIEQECWSARELFTVLEYIKWDKFVNVIDKAKLACENSGQVSENHFPEWRN